MNLIQSNIQTMSSREIAERTGKTHSNVKRDIASMVLQLNFPDRPLKDCPTFNPSHLKGYNIELKPYQHLGNSYDEFWLDQEMSLLLASGYNVTLRHNIIKRWQELENQTPALPQTFAEALQLAADQAKHIEQQQKQIEAAKPAIEFTEKVQQSEHTYSRQEAGKKIQQRPNKFCEWLEMSGYTMARGIPKQRYIDQGLMVMHTGVSGGNGHEFSQCRVTTKGLQYFSDKLKGIRL